MQEVSKKIHRVVTLDILRGYFLLAVIIDHLRFFPNGIDWLSAQGGLFVTAAEGFFFISGIVLGIVRGAKLLDVPFHKVARLLLNRAVQLYITFIILVLLFTFIGWIFYMQHPGLKLGILPLGTSITDLLFQTITLQYFYGWADYLRLYALFIFVSPLAMWLLRQGKWYMVLVLSFFVWLLFPGDPNVAYELQEKLQVLSWQLLFFGGMIIGFHWPQLSHWWTNLPGRIRSFTITSGLVVAAITLLTNVLIMLSTQGYDFQFLGISPSLQQDLYIAFFDKERLPLTRIALALLWFWAAFYLVKRFEPIIRKWFGWLLITFGVNSLYVYTLHAFAIFFAHLYLQSGSLIYNFIITASIIAIILVMIRYKILMKVIPR